MNILFRCDKDNKLAVYCSERFGDRFLRIAKGASKTELDNLQVRFQRILRREAYRQEWFDFVEEDGSRHPLKVPNGTEENQLLIPTVEILPGGADGYSWVNEVTG